MTEQVKVVDAVVEQLTTEQTKIVEKLKTLDANYKTERGELFAELAPVQRALKALKVKVSAQAGLSFRKPMSEQGRANIKAALNRRSERLAAEAAAKAAAPAAIPSRASSEQSKPTSKPVKTAAKGGKSGKA